MVGVIKGIHGKTRKYRQGVNSILPTICNIKEINCDNLNEQVM